MAERYDDDALAEIWRQGLAHHAGSAPRELREPGEVRGRSTWRTPMLAAAAVAVILGGVGVVT